MDMIIRLAAVIAFLAMGYGAIKMAEAISEMKENIVIILKDPKAPQQ